jgi:hypothetical protein
VAAWAGRPAEIVLEPQKALRGPAGVLAVLIDLGTRLADDREGSCAGEEDDGLLVHG